MSAVKYYAKLSNQKEIVMSRAGKYPVEIKNGVSVEVTDNAVIVKGPKGELHVSLDTKNAHLVDVKVEDGLSFELHAVGGGVYVHKCHLVI